MRIKEKVDEKTNFQIKYKSYNYQVILFRLMNVSSSFVGYINKIFAKNLNIFIMIYRDNILIDINKKNHINSI